MTLDHSTEIHLPWIRVSARLRIQTFVSIVLAAAAMAHSPGTRADEQAENGALRLAQAGDATGPDERPTALQEVVVTATRREESLSKVPISVTAMTQESLDARGIKDIVDVARFTPGVKVSPDGSNNIAIRGIDSTAGGGTGAGVATTGIYIDDTPIQVRGLGFNSDEALPKTFDLERVEVLRGPQGTLFGAGSEGGTVRYILTQPSLTRFSTYARTELSVTQGGDPSYEMGAAAGGPIIDGALGARLMAWYRRDGGWIDRVNPYDSSVIEPDSNVNTSVISRLSLLWQPVEGLTVSPSILYQKRVRHDSQNYWPALSDPGRHDFASGNRDPRTEPDQFYLPVLKVQWDLGAVQLISNSSYYHRNEISGYYGTTNQYVYYQSYNYNPQLTVPFINPSDYPLIDAGGVHVRPELQGYDAPAHVTNKQENLTQEIRLQSTDRSSRLQWTVGAFWSLAHQTSQEDIYEYGLDQFVSALFGLTPEELTGLPPSPTGLSYSLFNEGHDRQLAGFGEVTYGLTDALKLTLGARYSKTQFSFLTRTAGVESLDRAGHTSETPFTPKASLSWQVDPNNMVYTTYAKGFRVGGVNAPGFRCEGDLANIGLAEVPPSYASDTVQSYEIGSKNNISNRVRLASSAYYIKWNGIQSSITLPTCQLQFTANVGSAVSQGFDFQAEVALGSSVTVEATIGYTDAKYTADSPGGTLRNGDKIGVAPWTGAVGLTYNFDVLKHRSYARLDFEARAAEPRLVPLRDPSSTQYNPYSFPIPSSRFASLHIGTTIGNWNVMALVDNLFDTRALTAYNQSGLDYNNPAGPPPPLQESFIFRPRTIGVNVSYRN